MAKRIYVVALAFESINRPILETHWAYSHAEAVGMSVMKRSDLHDLTGYEVIMPSTDPNGGIRDLVHKTFKWTSKPDAHNGGYWNRIHTIKTVREFTGWGLKESKDMVDKIIEDDQLALPF